MTDLIHLMSMVNYRGQTWTSWTRWTMERGGGPLFVQSSDYGVAAMGKVETCCIKGCRHTRRICRIRSFPANPRQRGRWLSGIKNNFDINFDYKKWHRMCDCHFPENCFFEKIGYKGKMIKRISKMAVPCKFPPPEVLENEPKQTRPPPKKRNYTEEIDKKLAKMKAKAEATAVEEPLNFTAGMNVASLLTQVPQPYIIVPPAMESSRSTSMVLCPPALLSSVGIIGLPVEQQSTMGYLIPVKVNLPLKIISSTHIQHPVVVHPGVPNMFAARVSSSKKSGDVENAVYLPVSDTEEMLEEFDEVDILSPLEELCRLCAETIGEQAIEIFNEEGRARGIPDLIMQYLPIEVSESDLLPLKVCTSCINNLETCHHMNLKCKQADATLRRLLARVEERDASPIPCVDNFCDTFLEKDSKKQDVDVVDSQGSFADDDDEKRILTCVYSDCNFQTHCTMKMLRHLPKFHKRYACSICWEDFKTRDIRERHKIDAHEGKLLCDLCGESLMGRRGLRQHMLNHLNPSERRFKCNICDAGYSTRVHLEKHMTRHSGERTLPCPKCNKMYLHKADVIKHLKTHVERNIFKCQQIW
ncbi:hypothetical protein B566_EDAN015107 [Ephemera danica]|nr:hypothetical protein B566_EDAN015107 [Ephemera danica]